ncbi:MAG TPA: Rid family hydrolase, partial [Actinomycetota bacterium]|nr:Rid family hydrolase [Actinomycetota bacterium]
IGFAHAVVASPGVTIHLGGQTGRRRDGTFAKGLVEQFDDACGNVVTALRAAGGSPEHLVSVQVFTTDVAAYRSNARGLGDAWRRNFGKHYPAVALFEIGRLFESAALVELVGVAVLPDE